MKPEVIDLIVTVVHKTPAAVLVRLDEDEPNVWLPLSAIELSENDPIPGVSTITLPTRLAEEKGLV
jgi:hypothetical protein